MPELKKSISKRVSGIMKRLFPGKSQKNSKYSRQPLTRRRSMPARDKNWMTESAVWRNNVENLCREFDTGRLTSAQPWLTTPIGEDGTIFRMRVESSLYREELNHLKLEAWCLKNKRDHLRVEMREAQRKQEEILRRKYARRSAGPALRYQAYNDIWQIPLFCTFSPSQPRNWNKISKLTCKVHRCFNCHSFIWQVFGRLKRKLNRDKMTLNL